MGVFSTTTAFDIGYRLGLIKKAEAPNIDYVVTPKPKIVPVVPPKPVVDVDVKKTIADQENARKQYELSGPTKEQRMKLNEMKSGSREIRRIEQSIGINRE